MLAKEVGVERGLGQSPSPWRLSSSRGVGGVDRLVGRFWFISKTFSLRVPALLGAAARPAIRTRPSQLDPPTMTFPFRRAGKQARPISPTGNSSCAKGWYEQRSVSERFIRNS